ncbi:MAG TPA: hypothetical protein VLD36_23095 [Burkholderiales bacterium]|nr:hypothetical protein [Burkholderiales bacterium]
MLLKEKVAVVYGAGGAVDSAVARALAREGASAFLTGRNLALVEALAQDIIAWRCRRGCAGRLHWTSR